MDPSQPRRGTGRKGSTAKSKHAAPATGGPGIRVLFLDIDGVLAPFGGEPDPTRTPAASDAFAHFDAQALQRLGRIVERTQCTIVLSSSWRASEAAVDAILARFRESGPPLDAITKFAYTTDVVRHTVRQWEIFDFVERCEKRQRGYPELEAWAALDDELLVEGAENARLRQHFEKRAVLVDSKTGIEDRHVDAAVAILLGPP